MSIIDIGRIEYGLDVNIYNNFFSYWSYNWNIYWNNFDFKTYG